MCGVFDAQSNPNLATNLLFSLKFLPKFLDITSKPKDGGLYLPVCLN